MEKTLLLTPNDEIIKKIIAARKANARFPEKITMVCHCGHGGDHHEENINQECFHPKEFHPERCKCKQFNLHWGIYQGERFSASEIEHVVNCLLTKDGESK